MNKTVKLKIDGMHCAACVRRVQTALSEVHGVEVKNVAVGSAEIELDEGKASPEAAVNAVNGIGFSATAERQ